MTDNQSSNDKPKFTLKEQLQKRRAQEIDRTIEARRTGAMRQDLSHRSDAHRATQTVSTPRPVAGKSEAVGLESADSHTPQPLGTATEGVQTVPSRKRFFILAGAILMIIIVVVGIVIVRPSDAGSKVSDSTSSSVTGSNPLSNQFKQSNIQISGVRNIPVSSNSWHANQIIEFDAQENGIRGSFILVSYSLTSQTIPDIFKVAGDRLKGWRAITASSAILLIAPGTSQSLATDVSHQLSQYLVAPQATQSGTQAVGQPSA